MNYMEDRVSPSFEEYSLALLRKCPELFQYAASRKWRIATEFGKAIVTKSGFVVAKVEDVICHNRESIVNCELSASSSSISPSVKVEPQLTAVVHTGADLFLRQCYCPEKFVHRVQLLNRSYQFINGVASDTPVSLYIPLAIDKADDTSRPLVPSASIAGPLCFSGDVLAGSISIPVPMAGDFIIALDAGANSISLFSRHCSRSSPAVYAYVTHSLADGSSEVTAACVRPAESTMDIFKFWGGMDY